MAASEGGHDDAIGGNIGVIKCGDDALIFLRINWTALRTKARIAELGSEIGGQGSRRPSRSEIGQDAFRAAFLRRAGLVFDVQRLNHAVLKQHGITLGANA